MDLFWRYVCQKAVSSGISPIDGIEPSVESAVAVPAVAVPVVAAVSVAAAAAAVPAVVEDRRGSTKSVVSVPNSESGRSIVVSHVSAVLVESHCANPDAGDAGDNVAIMWR